MKSIPEDFFTFSRRSLGIANEILPAYLAVRCARNKQSCRHVICLQWFTVLLIVGTLKTREWKTWHRKTQDDKYSTGKCETGKRGN